MCFRRSHQFLPSFTVHLFAHLCSSSLKQLNIQQAFPISFQSSFHIWKQRAVNPVPAVFQSLLFQWEDRKWWTSNQKHSQDLTGRQALQYSVPFPVLCIFHSFIEIDAYSTVPLKNKKSVHIAWDTQQTAACHEISVQKIQHKSQLACPEINKCKQKIEKVFI